MGVRRASDDCEHVRALDEDGAVVSRTVANLGPVATQEINAPQVILHPDLSPDERHECATAESKDAQQRLGGRDPVLLSAPLAAGQGPPERVV